MSAKCPDCGTEVRFGTHGEFDHTSWCAFYGVPVIETENITQEQWEEQTMSEELKQLRQEFDQLSADYADAKATIVGLLEQGRQESAIIDALTSRELLERVADSCGLTDKPARLELMIRVTLAMQELVAKRSNR